MGKRNLPLVREPPREKERGAVIGCRIASIEVVGIEAELENGTWKVSTVKTTEIAGRMGVRPGDRVESIDGQAIDGSTTYKDGAFKVKSMRVTRDGKATDLEYSQQPN
mgnify:CR=1 FL=1